MKRQASATPLPQIQEDPPKRIGQEKGFDNVEVDDLVTVLSVTETERNCIQEATTGQAKSNLWHTLRFLRLTARISVSSAESIEELCHRQFCRHYLVGQTFPCYRPFSMVGNMSVMPLQFMKQEILASKFISAGFLLTLAFQF